MRYIKTGLAALLVAAVLAGQLSAAEVSEAARAEVAPLVKALGADDFSVRAKAQKDLVELGAEFLPAITEAAEKTKNEEVKAGLQLAMSTITEQSALSPPAISIDLQNATGADVAAALSKAVGANLETQGEWSEPADKGVKLKLEKKPYWSVIAAINEKWPIDLLDTTWDRKQRINLAAPKDLYKRAFVQGGIAFVPVAFKKITDETGTLSLRIAVDPRIRILKQGGLTLTEVLDQGGKPLEARPGNSMLSVARGWVTTYSPALRFPERSPASLSSVKGEMKFLVLVDAETVEYPDLSKVVNKELEVGGYKLTLSKAEAPKGTPEIMYSTEGREAIAVDASGERIDTIDGEFEVTDVNGKYVTTIQVTGSGGGGGMRFGRNAAFVEPLKGRFLAPKRVKEITIPFTLKDIPADNAAK